MASSLSSFCSFSPPVRRHKLFQYPQVRSQSFKDKEKPENIVDANLNVLRQRIEEVKRKERFNACYTLKSEWCYQSGYDHKHKRDAMLSQSIELFALGTGAIGLVFLIGSLCICLVSLLTYLFIEYLI